MRTLRFASPIPALESKPIFFPMSSKDSGKPTRPGRVCTADWGSALPSSGTLWSPMAEPSTPKAPAASRVRRLLRGFRCGQSHAPRRLLLRPEFQHDPDLRGNPVEPPFPNGCSGEAAENVRCSRNQPDSASSAVVRHLHVDHNFGAQFLVEQIRRVI